MAVAVRLVRVHRLPGDVAASYECLPDSITVNIRDDLVTAEGARVLAEPASVVLSEHWQLRTRLHPVQGGGVA